MGACVSFSYKFTVFIIINIYHIEAIDFISSCEVNFSDLNDCFSGLGHNIPQLVDVCTAFVGLYYMAVATKTQSLSSSDASSADLRSCVVGYSVRLQLRLGSEHIAYRDGRRICLQSDRVN